MASVCSGVVFIALAVIGFSSFISTALSASRDARSATLSVRSAPEQRSHLHPCSTDVERGAQCLGRPCPTGNPEGQTELADAVRERFLRLCEKSGFAESFDAVTGEGLRDRAYTWTASAYLLFARAQAEQR